MQKGIDSRLDRVLAGQPQALADAITASHLMIHCASMIEQRLEAALVPLRLQLREYLALYLLADSVHESVSPTQLSTSLKATRTQVTRLLDILEAKGLVVRLADTLDRRSLALQLTAAGSALLEQAIPLVQQAHLRAWQTLGATGTQALQQPLRALYAGLMQRH